MEYIRVTKENLEEEHICCAISNNKDVQVSSKKAWLADRFDEGLVFLKSVERGKCFIEYIPAEHAWNPIEAPGYMYIDCLWVSGPMGFRFFQRSWIFKRPAFRMHQRQQGEGKERTLYSCCSKEKTIPG